LEPDHELRLDSPVKIRLEREWIYFKLKQKVDAGGTIQLAEAKELDRLLTEIESSMEDYRSPSRLGELTPAEFAELYEARLGRSLNATSEISSAGGNHELR
jgi:hypothetical protein